MAVHSLQIYELEITVDNYYSSVESTKNYAQIHCLSSRMRVLSCISRPISHTECGTVVDFFPDINAAKILFLFQPTEALRTCRS